MQSVWDRRRVLLEEYCKDGLSLSEMARRFHSNKRHVRAAITRYAIPYQRFRQTGKNNPAWRGGVHIEKRSYVLVYAPDHPYRNSHNKVRLHRLVMERTLGRLLEPTEVVHHKNGNTLDNRPENLELFASNAEHLAKTLVGRIPKWTEQGKRNISESTRAMNARRSAIRRQLKADGVQT